MRTLNRYILRDFWVGFGMTLGVITLILYLGSIMRGLDYIARGVPGPVLLKVFTLNIPFILTVSIPVSILVATLLQFNRLSLEGEFTAMRAGGLGIWQIISPVILSGFLLTFICFVLQVQIAPDSRYAVRNALREADGLNPIDLLDEGRAVEFPGLSIYITRKRGMRLEDVEVYELNSNGDVVQATRAKYGDVTLHEEEQFMRVLLHDVQLQYPDEDEPEDLTKARIVDMKTYEFVMDYREFLKNKPLIRKTKNMRFGSLINVIRNAPEVYHDSPPFRQESQRMRALLELHKRMGLSLACISFTLIAIPLGMTTRRSETNVGIPIGLSLVVVFHTFIIVAESFREFPWKMPDYIMWIPVIVTQVVGLLLIRRIP